MIRAVCPALVGLVLVNSIALAQRPSDEEAAALIERSRSKAQDYARSLPDFVCTEIINRDTSYNPPVQRKPIPTETLTVKLSYFQQKEEHKLLMVDNKPTDLAFENLSGAIGTGEFGSTLKAIFDPKSATSFHWERWKNVRKHRAAVYAYVVDLARSQYLIGNSVLGHLHKAVVGYHGEMDIDTGNRRSAPFHLSGRQDSSRCGTAIRGDHRGLRFRRSGRTELPFAVTFEYRPARSPCDCDQRNGIPGIPEILRRFGNRLRDGEVTRGR